MSDLVRVAYTDRYARDYARVSPDQRRRIVRRLRVLQGKPWTAAVSDGTLAHLRDGVWEVRVVGSGPAYRLIGFVASGNPGRVLVLTGCSPKADIKKKAAMNSQVERAITIRATWPGETGG